MKICIIYLKYSEEAPKNQPSVKVVAQNYGIYPSVTLGYVAAIAEKAGHNVKFIDANALNLSNQDVIKEINLFKPNILAFTITTYLFHQTIEAIREIKQKTNTPVLVGGVHVSLYPKETLTYKEIDYALIGEAETCLPEFLEALEKNQDFSKVKSLCYKENNEIKINELSIQEMDINKVLFPARHLFPNEKYYSFISQRKNFTGMITSRGCPFRCIYCEQGSKKFRFADAKRVVEEFTECYNNYKIREIDIFDSSFTVKKDRVLDICKELISNKIDISWSIRSRVDCIDKEMLKELKKAGCMRVYYGIESGVPRILETLRKETNIQRIEETIKETKMAGINTFGYFMLGCPGDTTETIKKTIEFAKKLKLDYAQFSKVSPLPGTELYDKLLKPKLKEDYWSKYILNKNYEYNLPRPDCNLSEEEIQKLVETAYKEFYFRPKYITKAILRIKSFNELKRSTKAVFEMLTKF
ncbi:MAG TPA: radical SAM protein [Candidatus Nanoarchaeia archaeon]|nr:radical SAM protein [Candidatus Nanoarchaeia archaeon]